jgi:REP element-mobilizing transposase RayT
MSRAYKFHDTGLPYFVSFAVINWIDLFTRKEYIETVLASIKYCQETKGLLVHAWTIMPSHVHLIVSTKDKPLQAIMRDLKSFTSHKIKEEIQAHPGESRREWLNWMFGRAGLKNSNNKDWQLWQQDNHPIELWDNYMIDSKLDYLHNNPVEAGIVREPEHYQWSSAFDYAGGKGPISLEILE